MICSFSYLSIFFSFNFTTDILASLRSSIFSQQRDAILVSSSTPELARSRDLPAVFSARRGQRNPGNLRDHAGETRSRSSIYFSVSTKLRHHHPCVPYHLVSSVVSLFLYRTDAQRAISLLSSTSLSASVPRPLSPCPPLLLVPLSVSAPPAKKEISPRESDLFVQRFYLHRFQQVRLRVRIRSCFFYLPLKIVRSCSLARARGRFIFEERAPPRRS